MKLSDLVEQPAPTLWGRSYFCATVGTVSEKTVRHYIESQKGK